MAVYSYGSTNVSWSSTDNWANEISGNSNISVSGSSSSWADDIHTLPGPNNVKVSEELQSQKLFYGNVIATSNGTVRVSSPYTTSYSSGTVQVKNVNLTEHTDVRLQASPTYPYVFTKWSSNSGGSDSLSTSNPLVLGESDETSTVNFYAIFGNPSSNNATLSYDSGDSDGACTSVADTTVYWSDDDGANFFDAFKLYSNASLTTTVTDGFYSNGTKAVEVTSGVPGVPEDC